MTEYKYAPAEVPQPFTGKPQYYLYRMFSMPMSKWEMLTGLSRETAEPEEFAEEYKQTVRKKLLTGASSERALFGPWYGAQINDPTTDMQAKLEPRLRDGSFQVNPGAAFKGVDEEANEENLQVEYFVLTDPFIDAAETPEPILARADSPVVPFFLAFGVAGLVTASMVEKGTGLKVLAGTAGGLFAGVAVTQVLAKKEDRV